MQDYEFYKSVVEAEKDQFDISDEEINSSYKIIAKLYCYESLRNGYTMVDYCRSEIRCAYIRKFATCHTEVVRHYFLEMMRECTEIQSIIKSNSTLQICSFGGGPGTDVVGFLKALAAYSRFDEKVSKVTILDICCGWSNSFKFVMKHMCDGHFKGISPNVFSKDLCTKLIPADLLRYLPNSAQISIKEADLIFMIRFISTVINKPKVENAILKIVSHMKVGAIMFFIDNYYDNSYKQFQEILDKTNLRLIFGPLNSHYELPNRTPISHGVRCHIPRSANISVAAWMKSDSFQSVENHSSGYSTPRAKRRKVEYFF